MELMKWAFGDTDGCTLNELDLELVARSWREQHPDKKDVGEMTLKEASIYIIGQYCEALKEVDDISDNPVDERKEV